MYSYVNIMFLSVEKNICDWHNLILKQSRMLLKISQWPVFLKISLVTVTYMFMWLSHDKGLSKG